MDKIAERLRKEGVNEETACGFAKALDKLNKPMVYRLERMIDGEWYAYGEYDLSCGKEINAILEAAQMFKGMAVRAVRV